MMSDLDQQRSRKLLKNVISPKLNSFNLDENARHKNGSHKNVNGGGENMNNELMTQHNKVELRKSINIP